VAAGVRFAEVSDDEIDLYCGTGEPERVAGAFTVDGLGGWFVEAVDGDHHNVVGLSLPTLRKMLNTLGYRLADLGYPASRSATHRDS
jgi:septum formation protein